jgi:hypothetical protein
MLTLRKHAKLDMTGRKVSTSEGRSYAAPKSRIEDECIQNPVLLSTSPGILADSTAIIITILSYHCPPFKHIWYLPQSGPRHGELKKISLKIYISVCD